MKLLRNRCVLTVLRWALAAIFIYAGTTKLGSPQNFSDSIATFAILPNSAINLLALSLPPFEILAGLAIFSGIQRRPAILGLTVLTAIFMMALGSAIIRGISIDCGCFGSGKPSSSEAWIALSRDIVIFAVSLFLYLIELRGSQSRVPHEADLVQSSVPAEID